MAVDESLIPEDESARLAAVRRYDILDTPPDGAFERITALAAKHFDVPVAIVSIVDADRIWFKSHHGLDVGETAREPGLCASAILGDRPWVVENAETDPRALANPLVAGEMGLRFYAGAPLTTADGHSLGTLCLIDREPREFSGDQAATLADMAAIVMDELELRIAARRTVDHELTLREQAEQMARALQESLLPPALPRFAGADVAALYQPADAGVVGGDFYDVFEAGESCVLVVGDVSGKGPKAAAVTALARHALRTASLSSRSPADALATLNQAMLIGRHEPRLEHFCTVLVVWASRVADGLALTAAGAGHPPGLIRRAGGSDEWLEPAGPPVGWYPDAVFGERMDRLDKGDALILYTDGITEARTGTGMLGADGLASGLGGVERGTGAEAIVTALRRLAADDGVEVRDDAVALVVEAL